jgi:hypothetical protein
MLAAGRLRGGWSRRAGCGCRAGPAGGLRRAFAADDNRWASDQQRDFLGGGGAGRGSSFDTFFGARGQAASHPAARSLSADLNPSVLEDAYDYSCV